MDDKRMNDDRSKVDNEGATSVQSLKAVYEAPAIVSDDTVFERPALSCVDPTDPTTCT